MKRTSRIILLLVIDVVFFFVELIVGYAVGSLALVADSFHMLNDVMSLVVALYAIKLTNQTHTDARYSYGWHRAEILAALINGVFLLALCFSIFLEAIERFFSTPEHGHDHGHAHGKEASPTSTPASIRSGSPIPPVLKMPNTPQTPHTSRTRPRSDSYSSLYGHPAATRASLVQAAQDIAQSARARSPSPTSGRKRASRSQSRRGVALEASEGDETVVSSTSERRRNLDERTPLLISDAASDEAASTSLVEPRGAHGHGHAHGSMNMRALLLHVLGDALGNVGVIATGLVIWLSSWSFKYYFDPVISLVITVIIFSSALPLVRSTSFILLQGVPSTISLDDVREAILAVEGVLSLHELHIWQLSETKIVASVHVMASRKHDFMPIAAKIREALHHQGIHSSTIQPEYPNPGNSPPEEHLKTSEETSCLINCPPDQACNPIENACCPPITPPNEV
ncbi:cation efflux protein [Obba rivulosa]|uniref:Cation efflux protein n=1 Tax=Obba rivulosa TaxID=1052685 RepID=A0A8E2J7Y3_9APHY|nr:cation efflux protein [Obba rivulosa]